MGIIRRMRKQTAVYWPLRGDESGQDDFDAFGRPQWGEPYEIDCRWEDVAQEIIASDQTRFVTHSIVYVDRDVRPGGVLCLARLEDVNKNDPKSNVGAYEIRRFDKLPNLKNTQVLRTAYL